MSHDARHSDSPKLMHKWFDSTLNTMLDTQTAEWATCFAKIVGIPLGPATVLDSDLATTVQNDKIKFGPPTEEILSRLNSISNNDQIELLGVKLMTCSNWEELFAGS